MAQVFLRDPTPLVLGMSVAVKTTMNTNKTKAVFESEGVQPGVACIAPHKDQAGIEAATEILNKFGSDLITANGDDLLMVVVERYTTANYKDWWSNDVDAVQIVEYHGKVISLAAVPGHCVDAEWFEKLESDGGEIFTKTE